LCSGGKTLNQTRQSRCFFPKSSSNREFCRLIPERYSESFRRGVWIPTSDYGDYVEIRPEEAEDSLKKAREFVASAEKAAAEILK
jgi:uncharacterized protein (UPF0332 family)